jgi:hypothetical protein
VEHDTSSVDYGDLISYEFGVKFCSPGTNIAGGMYRLSALLWCIVVVEAFRLFNFPSK